MKKIAELAAKRVVLKWAKLSENAFPPQKGIILYIYFRMYFGLLVTLTNMGCREINPRQRRGFVAIINILRPFNFLFSGSILAAGYDLRSAYDYTIPSAGKVIAKTDLQIRVPSGTYGRVAPRSGLAAKHHIDVGAGVVDEDYTGNVGVVLFNHAAKEFVINKGDRIAQLVCEKIEYPELEECESLEETERGAGGFGSTGTN
jgi:dUTP pyrophosphatase